MYVDGTSIHLNIAPSLRDVLSWSAVAIRQCSVALLPLYKAEAAMYASAVIGRLMAKYHGKLLWVLASKATKFEDLLPWLDRVAVSLYLENVRHADWNIAQSPAQWRLGGVSDACFTGLGWVFSSRRRQRQLRRCVVAYVSGSGSVLHIAWSLGGA
jgi:hypothetical protein